MQVGAEDEAAVESLGMHPLFRAPDLCPTCEAACHSEERTVIGGAQEGYVMCHDNSLNMVAYRINQLVL